MAYLSHLDINTNPDVKVSNQVHQIQQCVGSRHQSESEGVTQTLQTLQTSPYIDTRPSTTSARQSSVQRARVSVTTPLPPLIETCSICGNVGHMAMSCALNQPPCRQPHTQSVIVPQTEPYPCVLPNIRPQLPSKFAGDVGEDVVAWTRDVTMYLQLYNVLTELVPAHHQILYASQFLTGEARDWHYHRAMRSSFTQELLFQRLAAAKEHFGSTVSAYTLCVKFLSCTHGNKSLEAYIRQLMTRYRKAIVAGNSIPDILLRDAFGNGLTDRFLLDKVHEAINSEVYLPTAEVISKARMAVSNAALMSGNIGTGVPRHMAGNLTSYDNAPFMHHNRVQTDAIVCYNSEQSGHIASDCQQWQPERKAQPLALQCQALEEKGRANGLIHAAAAPRRSMRHTAFGCANCDRTMGDCGHCGHLHCITKGCPFSSAGHGGGLTTLKQQTQRCLYVRDEQTSPKWGEDANMSQSAGQLKPGGQTSFPEQRISRGNQQQVEDLKGGESHVAITPSCPEQRNAGSTQQQVENHTVRTTSKVMTSRGSSASKPNPVLSAFMNQVTQRQEVSPSPGVKPPMSTTIPTSHGSTQPVHSCQTDVILDIKGRVERKKLLASILQLRQARRLGETLHPATKADPGLEEKGETQVPPSREVDFKTRIDPDSKTANLHAYPVSLQLGGRCRKQISSLLKKNYKRWRWHKR